MDYANGLRVPEGLLPSINEIPLGSLVIFFIHPDTDERTIAAHRKRLQTFYGEQVRFTSMESKQPIPLDVETKMLRAWKDESMATQVPTLCFYTYARRMARTEDQADLGFHYFPGYDCVNLQLGKARLPLARPTAVLPLLQVR